MTKSIEELFLLLRSKDAGERLNAVDLLADLSSDESIAGIVMALEDTDGAVRELASDSLAQMRGDTLTALLSEFLSSENIRTRNLAAEILVRIGSEAVIELIQYVKHTDHDVRKFVVDTLGLIGDSRAVESICEALWDENVNVVCSAAEALGLIASADTVEALIAVSDKIIEARPQALEALGRIGEDTAVDYLCERLSDEERLYVYTSVEALGRIGSAKCLPHLLDLLNHNSLQIASEAFKAALTISQGTAKSVEECVSPDRLCEFVRDGFILGEEHILNMAERNDEIWQNIDFIESILSEILSLPNESRNILIRVAQKFSDVFAKTILEMFGEASADCKLALLDILEVTSEPAGAYEVTKYCSDESDELRARLALFVGKMGNVDSAKTLARLSRDPIGNVRAAAFKAMGWLGLESEIPILTAGLGDEYIDVRNAAMGALVMIGGQTVIDNFTSDLVHNNVERQRLAASALGFIGEDDVLEPLTKAVGSSEAAVRRVAIEGLAKLETFFDFETVLMAINDEDESVQQAAMTLAARNFPQKAPAVLKMFLNDDNVWQACHAISALSEIDSNDTIEMIQGALGHPNNIVRIAATEALARMGATSTLSALRKQDPGDNDDLKCALENAIQELEEEL